MLLFLLACSDYAVSHSKLVATKETGEIYVADAESAEVGVVLHADAEALGPPSSSWVELEVFAAQEGGTPTLITSASDQENQSLVSPTILFSLTIDELFTGCGDPEGAALDTVDRSDGGCDVTLPVTLIAAGGDVSLQVEVHAEMDFGSNDAPGTLRVTLEE